MAPLIGVVLLLVLFGGRAAMAEDLVDFDPKEARVVLTLSEFQGLEPRIARRSPLRRGPDAMIALQYLVYSDDARLAVINHQTAATADLWKDIDLDHYIRSNPAAASLEKTIEPPEIYVRPGATGRVVRYTMRGGSDVLRCVAFDIKAGLERLIGFICLPGAGGLDPAEAKRIVNSVGIKDVLPPV